MISVIFKGKFDLGIWDKEKVPLTVKALVKSEPSSTLLPVGNEKLSVQRTLDSENCCQTSSKGPPPDWRLGICIIFQTSNSKEVVTPCL